MLKNILIPEKIGNYFIFSKNILGFETDKVHTSAIKVHISGKRQVQVNQFYEESLGINNGTPYVQKLNSAVKKITEKNKNATEIRVSFPSYLVIYKELTLPFTDISKIRSILDFEIEPILPFSIDQAVADFIVTKQDFQKKETTILVCVARKKDILEIIEPFKDLSVPVVVVVDVIALYGLFKETSKYSKDENIALISIESNHTNITYIQEGQLKLVRSIQQPASQIASEYKEFASKINFTLNSFKALTSYSSDVKKIVITGQTNDINNIVSELSNQINIPCEFLNLNSLSHNKQFIFKEINLPNSSFLNLAVAYPAEVNEDFNLLRKDLETSDLSLFKKQIISFILFTLLVLASLFAFSIMQIKKLKNVLNTSRTEVTSIIKNRFEITDNSILKNLQETVRTANSKVNEEETIWYAFSNKTKFSYLKYLQELSSIIDKESTGIDLKKLTIADGIITLEGEVKDFKALEVLENELNESKLFGHVSVPQETKFNIKITIKKNEDNN